MESTSGNEKSSDETKKDKKRVNGFEEWGGYMSAKKRKLESQFENQKSSVISEEKDSSSKIFEGISIYVNGYTKPSADELRRLMMLHGGTYHHYYSSNTNFMVASNLPDSKLKSLKMEKVVKPDWITDSIKARRVLPFQNYLLYSPEFTDKQTRLGQKTRASSPQTASTKQSSVMQINTSPKRELTKQNEVQKQNSRSSTHQNKKNNSSVKVANSKKSAGESKNFSSLPSTKSPDKGDRGSSMKAGHPDFISEFYSHSRLHHISTAGQELKQYVQQLACEQKSKDFPGRVKIRTLLHEGRLNESDTFDQKSIMHIDMDCFFVSVGLKKFPELKGQPVAVAHARGGRGNPHIPDEDVELSGESSSVLKSSEDYGSRSEIACCSYEARKAGLHNGMYLGKALKLCPQLKTIPYDFEEYSKVSKQLYDIVASYTLDIEAVSCDELYIDCSELLNEVKISPSDFAALLREEIQDVTGCTASAGVGRNMLLARLATRVAKPNGQYILQECDEIDFMKHQKVEDLPGIGYSTKHRLHELGINTCSDLQRLPLAKLQQEFGTKNGQAMYDHSRGKDDKSVSLEKDRKSVSAEINYGIRFEKEQDIYDFLNELAVEVHNRLKGIEKRGRTITLKLKVRRQDAPKQTAKFMGHGICDNVSKSVALKSATDDIKIIANECCCLARSLKISPEDYRGVGIQVGKLEQYSSESKKTKTMEAFLSKEINSKNSAASSSSRRTPEKSYHHTNNSAENEISKQSPSKRAQQQQQPTASVSRRVTLLPDELDQSVLDALPEDIRMEVLAAYAGQQEAFGSSNNAGSSHKSPVPKKVQNGSTRGRKSKAVAAQSKPVAPQNTLEWYMKTANKAPSPAPPSPCSCVDSDDHQLIQLQPPPLPVPMYERAHLGGATDINEVRELVKEWIGSAEAPGEDDIEQFKDYLLRLIEEDLEKMDFVLKYFYRMVSASNILWKEAYLLILSYVQQKMLQDFGYMLKAETKFRDM